MSSLRRSSSSASRSWAQGRTPSARPPAWSRSSSSRRRTRPAWGSSAGGTAATFDAARPRSASTRGASGKSARTPRTGTQLAKVRRVDTGGLRQRRTLWWGPSPTEARAGRDFTRLHLVRTDSFRRLLWSSGSRTLRTGARRPSSCPWNDSAAVRGNRLRREAMGSLRVRRQAEHLTRRAHLGTELRAHAGKTPEGADRRLDRDERTIGGETLREPDVRKRRAERTTNGGGHDVAPRRLGDDRNGPARPRVGLDDDDALVGRD